MKANELMIGDWVYDTITQSNIKVWAFNFLSVSDRQLAEALEPISLTDEILEANFSWFENKNHERVYECTNDYIDAYISLYTDGLWEVTVDEVEFSGLPTWKMYVSYVHELQHALRLANIDKEIEL